ncbi:MULTISPECIES: winged helix-turn-helix transcriptional regulator [Burkholderia cepacia complex]|uniref:winged helix-turn-helix transcriptional regulator n=1 Tax=Burkholderia cepacia complex TaxID=87882 RepID=UPI001CF275EE|nr:helix-turn-helix transcriptional regulator [Burkholderia cepacia]
MQQCFTGSADLCRSVGDVLTAIGNKWSILTIAMLSSGSMQFAELKHSLGSISQIDLISTLRGLIRDGYILQIGSPFASPRVDYELTELGKDVLVPVRLFAAWIIRNRGRVERARAEFDHTGYL